MSFALWNVAWILTKAGMNPESSAIAGQYVQYLLWGLYMDCLFSSVRMYLTSLENTFIPLVLQIVSISLHPIWCYLIVTHSTLGVMGCALAQDITYSLQFVLILIYLRFAESEELQACVKLPSMDSFGNMNEFLSLARFTLLIECLELWSYEIIALMSGYLAV
jgi:multidrug resistance protein, MATE family